MSAFQQSDRQSQSRDLFLRRSFSTWSDQASLYHCSSRSFLGRSVSGKPCLSIEQKIVIPFAFYFSLVNTSTNLGSFSLSVSLRRDHTDVSLWRRVVEVCPSRSSPGQAESIQSQRVLQVLFALGERNADRSFPGLGMSVCVMYFF